MNEVTKIHLGRQAFTISLSAQKELRSYLSAISKQVSDNEVTDEIELRMAELLTERGISDEKVILPADIKYLKEQLGDPKDFKDDEDAPKASTRTFSEKRLFRDPKNAWIAGVASGLATYFGVDILLIRLLFIIATFAGGSGIPIYIVLWLLVPEAKTNSDRLQMAGKPITIESLKDVVERADIKGAAHRAGDTLAEPAGRARDAVNRTFRIIVKIVGIALTLFGLMILAGISFSGIYLLVHGNIVSDNLFPVGLEENLLAYSAVFVGVMIAIFIILFGMTVYSRKWPIRTWLTAALVGLTVIGAISGSALAADTVPKVRDRYNAQLHTTVRQLKPFQSVNIYGEGVSINFQTANTYSVSLQYFDNANVANIKTNVDNGVLNVDSQNFDWHRNCSQVCIPDTYNMVVTVYSPDIPQINSTVIDKAFAPPPLPLHP